MLDVTIRCAANGWIATDPEGKEVLFEHDDRGEVLAFAELLRWIDDTIGPSTSRYSLERVRITLEPGDKHEPVD